MKKSILLSAALLSLGCPASHAAITITTPANNNVASTNGFSLAFTSTGLTLGFTPPDTPPLPSNILLESFTFQAGGIGGGYSGGDRYLAVFIGASFNPQNYVGLSTNQLNLETTGDQTYTFNNLQLSTSNLNYYYFTTWTDSNTNGIAEFAELTQAVGRLRLNTTNPLDQGTMVNADGGVQNASWDVAGSFVATAVPEPSSLALLGLGGLMLMRRRRR